MISPTNIEWATYASWPAFEQIDYQGWILRFADGYTKRANSVNAIVPINKTLPEAVAYCDSFYKTRQQRTIFRLLSFVDDPTRDLYLADAGYLFIDPSLVLYQALDHFVNSTGDAISMDRASWLKVYNEISGTDPSKQAGHAKILHLVPDKSLFIVLENKGKAVACGLGVIHESYFGIFDIVTRKEDRQQGHGTQLVTAMLAWAYRNGGRHAYVQVMAHNAPAVRLYENLGYRRLYHYWYRIQKTPSVK